MRKLIFFAEGFSHRIFCSPPDDAAQKELLAAQFRVYTKDMAVVNGNPSKEKKVQQLLAKRCGINVGILAAKGVPDAEEEFLEFLARLLASEYGDMSAGAGSVSDPTKPKVVADCFR